MSLMAIDGQSTGYDDFVGSDVNLLNQEDLARRATSKAAASKQLDNLESGSYTVILEPHAVADMLAFLAYAGLGQRDEAVKWGTLATELLPVSVDAFDGPAYLADLARTHAMVGEPEAALDLIERLLSMPAGRWMSKNRLRLDPRLASLRGHPRYERMVSGR